MCLYCESNDNEHFVCSGCGDGMCEECYDKDIEHDQHYHNAYEDADNLWQSWLLQERFGSGYVCQKCVDNALSEFSSKEEYFAYLCVKYYEENDIEAYADKEEVYIMINDVNILVSSSEVSYRADLKLEQIG